MLGVEEATWLPLLRRVARDRCLVLGLHSVAEVSGDQDPHGLCTSPDRLRRTVHLLRRAGFRFVTLDQLASAWHGHPPAGHAVLTFDDGMQDNHDVLLPLLDELGVKATVFVITGMIGGPNPWIRGTRLMNESELLTLHRHGIELGSHTVTHADLATLGYDSCLREMTESRATLEDLTGSPVTSFAYPYCSFGAAARQAVRDAGFRVAVTGRDRGDWDLLHLNRAMLTRRHGTATLALKATGSYDRLFESHAGRAARVATRGLRNRLRALSSS